MVLQSRFIRQQSCSSRPSRLPARHREPLRRGGRGKPLPQKLLLAGTEARPTAQRPALPKQQGLEQLEILYSMPYALCSLPIA